MLILGCEAGGLLDRIFRQTRLVYTTCATQFGVSESPAL